MGDRLQGSAVGCAIGAGIVTQLDQIGIDYPQSLKMRRKIFDIGEAGAKKPCARRAVADLLFISDVRLDAVRKGLFCACLSLLPLLLKLPVPL